MDWKVLHPPHVIQASHPASFQMQTRNIDWTLLPFLHHYFSPHLRLRYWFIQRHYNISRITRRPFPYAAEHLVSFVAAALHRAEVSAVLSLLLGGPFLGLTQFRTLEGAWGAEIPLPALHRFAFIKEELLICCTLAHPFGLLSSWVTPKSSKTIRTPQPFHKGWDLPPNPSDFFKSWSFCILTYLLAPPSPSCHVNLRLVFHGCTSPHLSLAVCDRLLSPLT